MIQQRLPSFSSLTLLLLLSTVVATSLLIIWSVAFLAPAAVACTGPVNYFSQWVVNNKTTTSLLLISLAFQHHHCALQQLLLPVVNSSRVVYTLYLFGFVQLYVTKFPSRVVCHSLVAFVSAWIRNLRKLPLSSSLSGGACEDTVVAECQEARRGKQRRRGNI